MNTETKQEDHKRYKPELNELDSATQSQIDKFSLQTDSDTFNLVRDHIVTNFINDVLFTPSPQTGRLREVNDQYFRGVIDGIDIIYDYIHRRAELSQPPQAS